MEGISTEQVVVFLGYMYGACILLRLPSVLIEGAQTYRIFKLKLTSWRAALYTLWLISIPSILMAPASLFIFPPAVVGFLFNEDVEDNALDVLSSLED